jgi:YegS/Rv2252/BmrU family lipid kinase
MNGWWLGVNLMAGRRSADIERVKMALHAAGVTADLIVPGSVEEWRGELREAVSAGRTRFAVVGGDGTVNLTVNTLLETDWPEPPILGVLPAGTGCDLLRTFAIPQTLEGAATHLATETTYEIDVATLEGGWGVRHFVNVAQLGVGAAAAATAPRIPRGLGTIRYPLAFGVRLPRFPRAWVTVKTERRTYEADALAVILANAQFFAGGWNVAPRAAMMDGLLDLQIISTRKKHAPRFVPKLIKGTHLADPDVRRASIREYLIETDVPWPVEADGDLVGMTPVRGRVIPGAVRLKI